MTITAALKAITEIVGGYMSAADCAMHEDEKCAAEIMAALTESLSKAALPNEIAGLALALQMGINPNDITVDTSSQKVIYENKQYSFEDYIKLENPGGEFFDID